MWRYEVSNNPVQNIHATHGNAGVVAVADTPVDALRLKQGKSKRLFGSLTGFLYTSRRETVTSMEMSCTRMGSDRSSQRIIDSIPAWRELPAPAWASLILRDAITC